jgi:hypothetical protein
MTETYTLTLDIAMCQRLAHVSMSKNIGRPNGKRLDSSCIKEFVKLINENNKELNEVGELVPINPSINEHPKRADACFISLKAECKRCQRAAKDTNTENGRYVIKVKKNPISYDQNVPHQPSTTAVVEYTEHKHHQESNRRTASDEGRSDEESNDSGTSSTDRKRKKATTNTAFGDESDEEEAREDAQVRLLYDVNRAPAHQLRDEARIRAVEEIMTK